MYSVLVAEDEVIIRKGIIFSINWEKLGIKLIGEADNGEEGIKLIEELKPDIVITDINMPITDGLEMIKRTKNLEPYSAIIISGYSDFEYAKEAINYGVSGYLLKPYSEEELEETIRMAIKQCDDRKRLKYYESTDNIQLPELLGTLNKKITDPVVEQIVTYIHQNYSEKTTIHNLEELVSYSERMINIKFKEEMGTTVIDYLNRYRIQQAINMLAKNKNNINEIAVKCGFGDYKYFRVVFKKYIGVSPKEFLTYLVY